MAHSVQTFREKFEYFVRKIERMDQLFEASFLTLSQTTGKFTAKCGKCNRYSLRLVSTKCVDLIAAYLFSRDVDRMAVVSDARDRPARMYCTTCDELYSLPQNVNVKARHGTRLSE